MVWPCTTMRPGSAVRLRRKSSRIHIRSTGSCFSSEMPGDTPASAYALEAEGGGSEYWVGYNNFRVITRYNRSLKYALAAFEQSDAETIADGVTGGLGGGGRIQMP